MADDWDIWPEDGPADVTEKRKSARLAGPNDKEARVLIKLHDFLGRAIYVFNLTNGQCRRYRKPSQAVWDKFATAGVEVPHPSTIPVTAVDRWVEYGKQQAAKLGWSVG